MKSLSKYLPEKWRLPAYKDLLQVIVGAFSRNVLKGLFKLMVAGFLGPAAMGILRSVYALFNLITNLADLGLDHALVTFLSKILRDRNLFEKQQLLRTVLCLKLSTTAFFLITGNLFAETISVLVLSDSSLTPYLRLVLFALGGKLLWNYISSYLSAHQYFDKIAYFFVTGPVLMWLMGGAFILLDAFDLHTAILIYLFTPMAAMIFWWPLLHREANLYPALEKNYFFRLLAFSSWAYLWNFFSSVRRQANILLLKNSTLSGSLSSGEINAGLYSFSQDLAGELALVSSSLFTVLLPKASRRSDAAELKEFLVRSYNHMVLLLIPLALPPFLFKPFLEALTHFLPRYLEYLPAIPACILLYVATLFALLSTPITTVLYVLKRPRVGMHIEVASGCLLIVGSILLIPEHGYMGAAIMVLVQRAFSFILLFCCGLHVLNRTS